jgi:hypothetical protein
MHVLQLTATATIALVMHAWRLDADAAAFVQREHVGAGEATLRDELYVDDIAGRRAWYEDG